MKLPTYPLLIALTRPDTNRLGVPHKAFVLLVVGTEIFAMWFARGNFLYYLAGVPVYLLLRGLFEWDPNFMRLGQLWARTKPRGWVKGRWLSPLPHGLPSNVRDIAGAV